MSFSSHKQRSQRRSPDRPSGKPDGSGWLSRLLLHRQPSLFDAQAQAALDGVKDQPPTGGPGSLTREGLTLADLKPGECGYISQLTGSAQNRLRLLEMGMTPGTHVQVLRAAAFGGPLDVHVRGYQLSLRREEAVAVLLGRVPVRPTLQS